MTEDKTTLRAQVEGEIEAYIAERRAQVDNFVTRHFTLPAVALAHQRSLRKDLVRQTLNLALALPSLLIRRTASLAEKLGFDGLTRVLDKIPLPLRTAYEEETENAALQELLGLDGESALTKRLKALSNEAFLQNDDWLKEEAQKPIKQWSIIRSQVLDGLGSFAVLSTSYLFFKSGGHGPLDLGKKLASERAKQQASSNFFLGETVGNVFYSFAPVKPSALQVAVATLVSFVLLASLTMLVNIAADPLQRQFGAHQRQLHKALDQFEERLVLALKRRLRAPGAKKTDPFFESIEGIMDRMGTSSKAMINAATDTAQGLASKASSALTPVWRKRIAAGLLLLAIGGYISYEALRYDAYEEPEDLIDDRAYATALARIEVLQRHKYYKLDARMNALRARALCGNSQLDACVEVYERLLRDFPAYRTDTKAILDLASALSRGNSAARRVLVQQVGPEAKDMLEDLALEKRPLERWLVVDTLTDLGASELPMGKYVKLELDLATTCDEKRRAVDKLAPRHLSEADEPLRALLGAQSWKCVHANAKAALRR